ncbi:Uncharacterised protein [Mycobacteroides abscessus subsp. abscessus]|nr:Uncharacterised protein [Mycobacteroides abscessus subsp. abscessus]
MPDHEGAAAVVEDLAQGADLTDRVVLVRFHDGQRLVQPDGLTVGERGRVDVRRAGQPHLATRSEHVDRLIVVHADQDAVSAGRLTQPIDLLAQRHQLLARFLEGVHQLGVANGQRIDAGFQFTCAIRRIGELPSECSRLGAYRLELSPGRRIRILDGAHVLLLPVPVHQRYRARTVLAFRHCFVVITSVLRSAAEQPC